MTRFTRLLDIFDDMYDVPTKEEYEELKQSISERFERLESRIAAIEKPLEKNIIEEAVCEAEEEYERMINESPDNEKTQITLMNGAGDTLELEGTEKQIEAFEAERKERNDRLFPSCMSFMENVRLALEHGLTVKKITTQENKEK